MGWLRIECSANLFSREVDTHYPFFELVDWYLEAAAWDSADDYITQHETLLKVPVWSLHDFVHLPLNPFTSGELLYTSDVNTVHAGTVICQHGCQRSTDSLTSIDDRNNAAIQSVTERKDILIYPKMIEDFHDSEWRAR